MLTADAVPFAASEGRLNPLTLGLTQVLEPAVRVNSIVPGAFRPEVTKHYNEESATGVVGRLAGDSLRSRASLLLGLSVGGLTTCSTPTVEGSTL